MKKAAISLILTAAVACASPPSKPRPAAGHDAVVRTIAEFFERAAADLERAGAVVIERDLVKNLTHLQRMNAGGDRYYLLERENLTKMIRSVTQGVYRDTIIINRDGLVVYTMHTDNLFGKNVLGALRTTELRGCYENRTLPLYVSEVTAMPGDDDRRSILVSMKVSGGNTMGGILVLQIDTALIARTIGTTVCVGGDGRYRIHRSAAAIGTPRDGNPEAGTPFTFANVRWFLFDER